jgi:hypothetical protein
MLCGNQRTREVNRLVFPVQCVYMFCGGVVVACFLHRKRNIHHHTICFSSIAFVHLANVRFVNIVGKLFLLCLDIRLDISLFDLSSISVGNRRSNALTSLLTSHCFKNCTEKNLQNNFVNSFQCGFRRRTLSHQPCLLHSLSTYQPVVGDGVRWRSFFENYSSGTSDPIVPLQYRL